MKKSSALAVSLPAMLFSLLVPGYAGAASMDPAELEALLKDRYYEVEFFVFERPQVLDFSTGENLALDRPRALPSTLRTQRLSADALWDEPLDPLTRACLTFPTLTYELLPAEPDALDPAFADATADQESTIGIDPATANVLPPMPLPEIAPTLEPNPQLDFLANLAEFERTLEAASQRWQPEENFQLNREANRVERRGLGRVLYHGRWLQAVPAREAPDPILVRGGERLSGSSHELVGTVGITLGRYLHFKADLFFHAPGLGMTPAAALMTASGESQLLEGGETTGADGYMQLSESRRMRSEELHYLDHPKLGVVVRVDPISIPEALLAELEALEALEESTD